jgi:D-psicose/D-tagatose/L-ribulose 3-epimerase
MKQINFSINSWIFGNTPIEEVVVKAHQIGVAGLDISGEPDTIDVGRIKKTLDAHGLKAFCINGNFTEETRVFCHGDAGYRKRAVEYGKKCVDMAVELSAGIALMVPSQVNGNSFYVSKEVDWQHSVESLREVTQYAGTKGVTIVLECVNKYEVMLVRTMEDGIRMCKQIGFNNVKIIGDTFHMNLEEENGIHNAIRNAGSWLGHLHLGDNTREVPGRGCINWREIMIALKDIDYQGALSFEPLPHRLTPEEIFGGVLDPQELADELGFSIQYLKSIMQTIA